MTSSPTPASPPAFHFKASRQPMLWAAVAYSLGIVAGVYLWRPVLWWIVAVAAFVAAAVYFAERRSGLGWSLALGAGHAASRASMPWLSPTVIPTTSGE
jgi:hypothetical protein